MGFKRLGCRVLGALGLASESFGRCYISTLGFAGAYGRVCAKNVYEACKDLQVEGPVSVLRTLIILSLMHLQLDHDSLEHQDRPGSRGALP